MERGPMALFGAIIAIGLGPAMWLGAQLGPAVGAPSTRPTVTVQQDAAKGGVGGSAPDPNTVATDPKANNEPLNTVPPKAHPVHTSPSPSKSPTPSQSPSASPTPGDDDSGTPTTGTTTSSAPPDDNGGDDSGDDNGSGDGSGSDGQVPPAPPTTDSSTPDSTISSDGKTSPAV